MRKYGISLIGAGRLGRVLARNLKLKGWKVHSVVARTESSARRAVRVIGGGIPTGGLSPAILTAAVIVIAVPDSAISDVAARLASFDESLWKGRTVLHTSGALSSEILARLRWLGAFTGSIHPLQTFSGIGCPPLEGRTFVIEGDRGALRIARSITRALGGHPVQLSAAAKPLYHAAAVFSAGHMLALQESSFRILVAVGMQRQEAMKALLPMSRQVLENLERVGPRAAWTGPLARGDYRVIAQHEDALRALPLEYLDAYRAVNRLAARVLASDPDRVLRELAVISANPSSPSKLSEVVE